MRKKMTHKLTEEQKAEILKLLEEGFSPTDIAAKFKVSRASIYNIERKRRDEQNKVE
jgi:transcriptional regulator